MGQHWGSEPPSQTVVAVGRTGCCLAAPSLLSPGPPREGAQLGEGRGLIPQGLFLALLEMPPPPPEEVFPWG